jgi:FkbM family methyltransferase
MLRKAGLNPSTIIDVGAYEGQWTRRMVPIFPAAHFLLFEAQPSKQEIIRRNLAKFAGYELEIAVLGAVEGREVTFYDMETGSSYYPELTSYPRTARAAQTKTLDRMLSGRALGEILIKLDTQGSELDILMGAPRLLEEAVCVILEASLYDYNKEAPTLANAIQFLDSHGFSAVDVIEVHRRSYDGALVQVDLAFLKRRSEVFARLNDFSRGI